MPLVPESVPVGLVVEMDLPELGLTDLAWVTDIADCPEIESRDSGRSAGWSVVTATFHHSSGDVIDLTLGSKSSTLAPPETIGTTSNHPFWSVDRQEYVQAGQLDVGERVLTFSGDTKRVVTKLPRPGPQPVYNLEVHAEHVYFVGEDGLLVHNTCNGWTTATHKRLSRELRELGVTDWKLRKHVLKNIRNNFTDFDNVRISRSDRGGAFYRFWDGIKAAEKGQYGTYLPVTQRFARHQTAVHKSWNTLSNLTRFEIAPGTLRVIGRTGPQGFGRGYKAGGGMQVFIPYWEKTTGLINPQRIK